MTRITENAATLAQLLGIERGNPLGIFVLLTVTIIGLGWWIYSSPGRKAAQHLIEFRKQMVAWQAEETARYEKLMTRYEKLWAEKLDLMKRCEDLEGKLARLKAERGE